MSVPNEISNLAQGVVASFESGIGVVGLLIDKGLDILDGYRREQEAVRGQLRERLATIGSLRRKDFDGMMEKILGFQSDREREIQTFIRDFLGRQKELASRLRRSLESGIFQEVERIKGELAALIDEARKEILSFQVEQEKIRKIFTWIESSCGTLSAGSAGEFRKQVQDLEKELFGTESDQAAASGH